MVGVPSEFCPLFREKINQQHKFDLQAFYFGLLVFLYYHKYRKNFKYWDMYVRANSVDSDQTALKEQSDQDLHCLPFYLHLLEALLHCKIKLFCIKDNYGSWSGCPNI